jgi:hypothetical protein
MASATKRISLGLRSFLSEASGVDDEDVAAEVGGVALGFAGEAEDVVGAVRSRSSAFGEG